jgi:ribosomal protein L14E/L6E/L27E
MIERNRPKCNHVEIFTHYAGSVDAPSRRTVYLRGTKTKLHEVPDIMSRNTKTSIFREGSARFKAMIKTKKKNHIKVMSPLT